LADESPKSGVGRGAQGSAGALKWRGFRLRSATSYQPPATSHQLPARILFMPAAIQPVDVLHVERGAATPGRDVAAAEEPLEIRLGGTPFVVIMRTPGADNELAAGFLMAEQILKAPSELASMRYCTDADGQDAPNVLNVWLAGEATTRAAARVAERRHVTATSACGVCGRRSIDDLMDGIQPVDGGWTVAAALITSLPDRLRGAQKVFEATGGLHAAGLFDLGGSLVAVAEDVGRHNAVDKVVGAELLAGRVPLSDDKKDERGLACLQALVNITPPYATLTAGFRTVGYGASAESARTRRRVEAPATPDVQRDLCRSRRPHHVPVQRANTRTRRTGSIAVRAGAARDDIAPHTNPDSSLF
jgi:FdhD protein